MLNLKRILVFMFFCNFSRWNGVAASQCMFEDVRDCQDSEEKRKCDARNLTVGVMETGNWAILGKAYIDLEKVPMVSLELTKCASKQEPETCMYFSTARYKNVCALLATKGELWSSFFGNTEPEFKCPMKGEYSFERAYVDLENKRMPGLEGFYWKLKLRVHQGKNIVCCVQFDVTTGKE